jgi:signal transduction histidine kinase
MRTRAALAGGSLRIDSQPGTGTTVEAWLPDGGA